MENRRKVLIITYYWPPSGGAGVQRWLKFVKYLRNYGFEPVVYTIDKPNFAIVDEALEMEIPEGVKIYRRSILEPSSTKISSKNQQKLSAGFIEDKPSLMARILLYIRANYFIPDARMLWIKPSARYLEKIVKEENIELIVSTGPPHSMHMIAQKLKRKTKLPWIADFRDPWTKIDYFDRLPLSKRAWRKHYALERDVLQDANRVLVIGNSMKEDFKEFKSKVHVLTNGYDDEAQSENLEKSLTKKFTIAHIGSMNADRNPIVLWKALNELCSEIEGFQDDLSVQLIGSLAAEIEQSLAEYEITQVERINYVPHKEVIAYQRNAQVLLLAVNRVKSAKGVITGKIFEYLNARRPILAVGPPDGDLAEILRLTNAGQIVDFDDLEAMKTLLRELYARYKHGNLEVDSRNIDRYHRQALTQELAAIFDQTLNASH